MLLEEAEKVTLFGIDMYGWGLYVAAGLVFMVLVVGLLFKKSRYPKGTAPLCCLLMMTFGFIFSRLLYSFTDGAMRQVLSLKAVLYVKGGGYSMFGALTGAFLGAVLCAKIMNLSWKKILDQVFCALLLFVAAERLGEGYTEIGISRPLLGDGQWYSFLVTQGEYDRYLSTYLLEYLFAFIWFIVCMIDLSKKRREGDTFLLGLMLFGMSQVMLESLRFDQHMKFSFVGVQQILSAVFMYVPMIIQLVRYKKAGGKKAFFAGQIVYLSLLLPAIVGLEFMIDRSGISRVLLYTVYAVLLMLPAAGALVMRRKTEGKEMRYGA